MVPGLTGVVKTLMIVNEEAEELPQALLAVTVIFPVEAPAFAVIELVVDDPLQPEGNVHV